MPRKNQGSKGATLPQLVKEYEEVSADAAKFMCLVRSSTMQEQQILKLKAAKDRIKRFKYGAIEAGDEKGANILFHLQCRLNAQASYIAMWIDLKREEYYNAWDHLIDTQDYISIALRSYQSHDDLEDFINRLEVIERTVFPGYQIFNSWGVRPKGGFCTVCGNALENCEHVEELVYSGRLCVRVRPELLEIDHVSMVDDPADRRCVVTEISLEDGYVHVI